jgi:hypothetical protein
MFLLIKNFILVTYGKHCYLLDLATSPKAWVALPDMPGKNLFQPKHKKCVPI